MRALKQVVSPVAVALTVTFGGLSTAVADVKPFQAEDIFALEHASDIQISPNGEYIVYVRNSNDIMRDQTRRSLWLLDLDAGTHQPLKASDEFNFSNPEWSPDSTRIAFHSNKSGEQQIHVHWLEDDRTARVTDVRNSPSRAAWSPDGNYLAFSKEVKVGATEFARSVYRPERPEGADWAPAKVIVERAYYQQDGRGVLDSAYRQLFVVPTEGGTARQLTEGPYNHGGQLAWTPDSESIVFSANRREDWEFNNLEANLYQVQIASGELTPVTDEPGRQYNPTFSPNGQYLAFLHGSNDRVPYRNAKLRVMDWSDGQVTELLSDFDRSVSSPEWQSNSRILFSYQDRGMTRLARVSTRDRKSDLVDDLSGIHGGRPYLSGQFSVADSGAIAYTRGHAQRPADVGYLRRSDPEYLTDLNKDLLGHRELAEIHEISYESSHDGQEIQGWYLTPPGFDPDQEYPLLVEIHGGPHLAYGPHFAAELQRYAAAGYVVFYNNYRGSTSYGKDFAMLLDGKYMSPADHADHMSGVDAMLEKGFIDEDNLFIAGGSAGGIATAYAVGLTDRFNAAAATNPVINWVSKVLTADSYLRQIPNQFPGMPWEELEHYWQRSPLSLVENVTTPVMMFTGEEDRRTPIADTEQFYQALQLQGVDTAMVRVPGAAHGVSNRPSNMIAKVEHALAWFDLYKVEQDESGE